MIPHPEILLCLKKKEHLFSQLIFFETFWEKKGGVRVGFTTLFLGHVYHFIIFATFS